MKCDRHALGGRRFSQQVFNRGRMKFHDTTQKLHVHASLHLSSVTRSQHRRLKVPLAYSGPSAGLPSPSASSSEAATSPSPYPEACDAVIVGGGPAGLGAALLLSRRHGWNRIVVLELRPTIDAAEPDKTYTYMIDGRGRTLTDEVGVTDAIEAAGVVMAAMTITRVKPDGTAETKNFEMKDQMRQNVWLPRRTFLSVLRSGLADAERQGRVRLLHATQVTSIQLSPPAGAPKAASATGLAAAAASAPAIIVRAQDTQTGAQLAFAPRLLLGADGINSGVRRSLAAWATAGGLPADHFQPVQLDSASAGLHYKVLPMPPNTPFRKPPGKGASATAPAGTEAGAGMAAGRLENRHVGSVEGVKAPSERALRLGFLPVRDPEAPRTANVIKPADHVMWSMTSGPQLRDFLQESFPQLDISALLTEEQLAAVAKSRGGVFPRPQYLRHFTAVLEPPASSDATSGAAAATAESPAPAASEDTPAVAGVALIGDAVHAFPPDLGQGVNSALTDVVTLVKALDETGGDLKRALPLYEARCAPEAAALAELMVFGGPYQYGQDQMRRALWSLNVGLRLILSRLAPWAFSPATFMLIQQSDLSYAQVLQRVHDTTKRLVALLAAVAAAAVALCVRAALAGAA